MPLKPRAVLLACGSYSPITNMHVEMLERAKDTARERGFTVVRGIISPVHDSYGKAGLAAAEHRLNMARLAVQGSNWIEVSEWESGRDGYSRSVDVARHVQECWGGDVTVVFVCGDDVVRAMINRAVWTTESIRGLLSLVILAVLPRNGTHLLAQPEDEVFREYSHRIWAVHGPVSDVSSSNVRALISKGNNVQDLVPDPVSQYILSNKLFTRGSETALHDSK